ncbi:MAG: HAD-IA family hydrolase [Gammaproteobacteria bacterium]|nr:HAD-IA family hydrolase [Gammaproteobacteria bacterium]
MSIQAVLFDLDGTLADTAPDLAYALNETLKARGHQPLPFEAIRPVVSHGGIAMIRLGFDIGPGDADYDAVREQFLNIYLHNIARHTTLFAGMNELLAELESRAIKWGVVTNKPGWLTDPLMAALGLTPRAAAIVSGDTCAKSKPHPEPMYHACNLVGVAAEHCVYVGDAERDIAAGRAANMRTLAATFGYLLPDDDPHSWQADALIDHPQQVLDYLEKWT